jgi:hypothetical protein
LKVCVACRSQKELSVGMGGEDKKNAISAKLVIHLWQAHSSDGQYQSYLKRGKYLAAAKNGKQQPSHISKSTITTFAGDNKDATKLKYKNACAKCIVETQQPLNNCDFDGFRTLINTVLKIKLPSVDNKVIKRILTENYYGLIETVKKKINDTKFALTLDHWTNKSNDTFGAMTIHFIEDFDFKAQTLCCQLITGSAPSVDIYTQFGNNLMAWGVALED